MKLFTLLILIGSLFVFSQQESVFWQTGELTDQVYTTSAVKSVVFDEIIYLKISLFNLTTANEFINHLSRSFRLNPNHQPQKLIIDLRDNSGGYIETAVKIFGLWADTICLIKYTEEIFDLSKKYGEGQKDTTNFLKQIVRATPYTSGDPPLKGMPTVILINRKTASAAEVVTAAHQEYGIATVVGERSYGKHSIQREYYLLPDSSKILVIVGYWTTPSGKSVKGTGVKPDIEIEADERDLTTGYGRQFEKALEVLKAKIAEEENQSK